MPDVCSVCLLPDTYSHVIYCVPGSVLFASTKILSLFPIYSFILMLSLFALLQPTFLLHLGLVNMYISISNVRKSMLLIFWLAGIVKRGVTYTGDFPALLFNFKANTFILYVFNKQKANGLRFLDSLLKNIKYNRFTNIFLIKSHTDLVYTKARSAYLWQNQTQMKDEVTHSCQVIVII